MVSLYCHFEVLPHPHFHIHLQTIWCARIDGGGQVKTNWLIYIGIFNIWLHFKVECGERRLYVRGNFYSSPCRSEPFQDGPYLMTICCISSTQFVGYGNKLLWDFIHRFTISVRGARLRRQMVLLPPGRGRLLRTNKIAQCSIVHLSLREIQFSCQM